MGAFSFIAALMVAQLSVRSVRALDAPLITLKNAGIAAWGTEIPPGIGTLVGNIILIALGLLGVVFVVLLTYGGFLWLTSAGEEEKTKKATGIIVNATIGVLIVVAAYSITYFVLSRIGTAVVGP